MPKAMQEQLIGYGPDMKKRIANAKKLLAAYEKEKGKIDWRNIKIQCSSNIKFSCENAQVVQQLLKKIDVNVQLETMLVAQHRANEVSGDFAMSLLGAAFDFDDPIDTFGQLFVTNGGPLVSAPIDTGSGCSIRATEVHRGSRKAQGVGLGDG